MACLERVESIFFRKWSNKTESETNGSITCILIELSSIKFSTPVLPPGGNFGTNTSKHPHAKWQPDTCMSCLILMMTKQDHTGETLHFNVYFLFSTS